MKSSVGAICRRRFCAGLLAVPGLAWAQPELAALPIFPPLHWQRRRLANGLELLALGQPGASVSVQLWYRVGGRDDPPGRSGFAHLFEHLMFKRTRYLASEQFDRMTEDVGGSNNASTAEDYTAYQSVVPAEHLEPMLWAEAERMSNLQLDQASFESEREVVKEEYRQRVLAEPYGALFDAVPRYGFSQHAYRRGVIGSIADLDAATLADVRAFHASYYRPDNALLIVCGEFDAAQLDRWVDYYFGSIRAPATPVPRQPSAEPRRQLGAVHELSAPQAPLPAAALIWPGPPAASRDAAALQVALGLLALGNSARLDEALVYRDGVASSIGFEAQLHAEAGLLVAHAIAAQGESAAGLAARLRREVHKLAEEPISPPELDKVKTLLLTAALVQRQTPLGLGELLGRACLLQGGPELVGRELQALRAVSVADVQRLWRRDIVQAPHVTLLYGRDGMRQPGRGKRGLA